jgi:hypothetical protein
MIIEPPQTGHIMFGIIVEQIGTPERAIAVRLMLRPNFFLEASF